MAKKTTGGDIAPTGDAKNKKPNIIEMGGKVEERIKAMLGDGRLALPPNYAVQNAIKSAELIIRQTVDRNGSPVLMSCTNESIYNALLDMAVQGLNPGKKQCYFIAYGNQLLLQRSYMGTVMVAKRLGGIKDVHANVVYLGDDFKYDVIIEGGVDIVNHSSALENRGPDKIIAAYAAIKLNDGGRYTELMTISEIKKAWGQGATRGNSPAHQNFPEEMAKKTVINRACKLFVNTSDDSDLLSDSFNRTTDNEYDYGKTDTQGPAAPPENTGAVSGEAARMDALLFGGADVAPEVPEPAHEEIPKDESTAGESADQADAEFEERMERETREAFGE